MADKVTVHFNYCDDFQRFHVVYGNGDSEQLALTCVGPEQYRLEESSFAGDAVYGDVINAKKAEDGSLLFQAIVERSKLVTHSCFLSAEFLTTEHMRAILDSVMAAGGMWEQAFGGLLIVHAPPDFATAVLEQIKDLWSKR
jgi:hypothetical protein